jgi:hypothetical protein
MGWYTPMEAKVNSRTDRQTTDELKGAEIPIEEGEKAGGGA